MIALAVDAANNDLVLGADGNLSIATDLQAVLQATQQAVQTLLEEMVYAADRGIPYFTVVWGGAPSPAQFEAYLRREVSAVEGVIQVDSVTVSVEGNELSYAATIKTIYGTGVING